MNNPIHSRRAAGIRRQLTIASACGMRVPSTLFTNEYAKLRDFATQNKIIVIKSGPLPGVDLEHRRLLTHIVKPTDIGSGELERSPCLFQEYIEKQFELRIHVIGEHVHACRIDSQQCAHTKIDWRNYHLSETPHFPFELDGALAVQCRQITQTLGLRFGILDVIVTPAGEAVFLECNSQGHWLWIEALTGLPITNAIADELIGSESSYPQPC